MLLGGEIARSSMAGSQGHSATRQALGAGGEEGLNLRKEPVNVAAGKEETEDDLVEGELEDQKSEVKVLDFKFKFYLLTVDRQYIFLLCAHFSAPVLLWPRIVEGGVGQMGVLGKAESLATVKGQCVTDFDFPPPHYGVQQL